MQEVGLRTHHVQPVTAAYLKNRLTSPKSFRVMMFRRTPRTVADFIGRLQLDSSDHQRLVEHLQKQSGAGFGPHLHSACNQRFRYCCEAFSVNAWLHSSRLFLPCRDYLLLNLPSGGPEGLSWDGLNTLQNALDQGRLVMCDSSIWSSLPAIRCVHRGITVDNTVLQVSPANKLTR